MLKGNGGKVIISANLSSLQGHMVVCFFCLNLWMGFVLAGCNAIEPTKEEIPTVEPATANIQGEKRISVNTKDNSKFIENLLGPEYLKFNSRTDFYWFELSASELIVEITERLLDANWQLESDWGYQNGQIIIRSVWTKRDLELSILLFDDLDSVAIDSLSRNYGISGPLPGSTMFVMHIIDKASPIR